MNGYCKNLSFLAKAGRQFDEICQVIDYICGKRYANKLNLKISVELEIRISLECARKIIKHADVIFVSKDFARDHGNFLALFLTSNVFRLEKHAESR
jgi:hypothetical protein